MKVFYRFIAFVLCFTILFSSFSVYASSETYLDKLNRVKDKICAECDRIFTEADILHDSIEDIYDMWVAQLTQTQQDFIDTLITDVDIFQYVFNSFTQWIKRNKLFGVQETVNGVPVPDSWKLVIRKYKESNDIDPSFNNRDDMSDIANDYNISDYSSNYPYNYIRNFFSKFTYVSYIPDDYSLSIWDTPYPPSNFNANSNFTNASSMFLWFSQSGEIVASNLISFKNSNNENIACYFPDIDNNWSRYWQGSMSHPVKYRVEDGYLYLEYDYISDNSSKFQNTRSWYYDNNFEPHWNVNANGYISYSTSLGSPFAFHGYNFINYFYGTMIIKDTSDSSHMYVFYNGQWYNGTVDAPNGTSNINNNPFRIALNNQNPTVNTNIYNNIINNYNTIINNIISENPDISLDDLYDILNQLDVSEEIENLQAQIDLLLELLNETKNDLNDIYTLMSKIKQYLRSIDTNVSSILAKIDSMFNNSGILILDAKLDYVYNHLSTDLTNNTNRIVNAINNISVSGGGGDVNIDFSDYFIDFDASLNVLFSLNNEQRLEIESDLDDIKAPFKWIGNMTDGVKTLYKKMIVRSSAYNGGSSGDIDNVNSLSNFMDSSISQNGTAADQTTDSSVGGSASVPTLQAPVIYLHFNNSTSSINYGGDVVALDFSWYANYKNTVDNIIVAFCWAVFIFNMIKHIPSLIRGEDKGE